MTSDPNVTRLRALDICDLSDALDALGLPPSVTGLNATSAQRPIAGRAVTVRLASGTAPAGASRHLCTAAVEGAGSDDVIVIEQRTGLDAAAWGGILSRAAKYRNVAGTIVDGPVRDIEESDRAGYTVYARSTTARTARGRIHEAACQSPIAFGNVTIVPGDFVAIDRSGCIVIPAARISDVLARAEDIRAKSDHMAAVVAEGELVSKVMSSEYETMLEHGKMKLA